MIRMVLESLVCAIGFVAATVLVVVWLSMSASMTKNLNIFDLYTLCGLACK